ncbi:MAG: type II secretion system protein [Gallionella sp.]
MNNIRIWEIGFGVWNAERAVSGIEAARYSTNSQLPNPKSYKGFTLIEMIMVIVITGIIGSMVAVFLKAPIQQYTDVSRRAELSNIADTALYQLASDISTSVPNSVRVAGCGSSPCVEFIPTKDGGRYRNNAQGGTGSCGAAGDDLDFSKADSCFEIVGQPINFSTGASGDYIVLGSTQSSGNPPYDTTAATGVLRAYTGASGAQKMVIITATQFPLFASLASPRFDVVDGSRQAITFSCEGTLGMLNASNDGQASMVKHWLYGFNAVQAAPVSLGGSRALLATKVSGCSINYDTSNQRMGLLTVGLTLTSSGESVTLYHEIHVNNMP